MEKKQRDVQTISFDETTIELTRAFDHLRQAINASRFIDARNTSEKEQTRHELLPTTPPTGGCAHPEQIMNIRGCKARIDARFLPNRTLPIPSRPRRNLQPALHRGPREATLQPGADVLERIELDQFARAVEAVQVAHPAQ
jgi:hypothetical protein